METSDVHKAAALVKHAARAAKSTDNISVIVVNLEKHFAGVEPDAPVSLDIPESMLVEIEGLAQTELE
jgi:serine/threonine protein phosphatase PrpC